MSLFIVPGGGEGPSGVLICSENYITYKNFGDQPDIRCPIPRRRVSYAVFIVASDYTYYVNDNRSNNKKINMFVIIIILVPAYWDLVK